MRATQRALAAGALLLGAGLVWAALARATLGSYTVYHLADSVLALLICGALICTDLIHGARLYRANIYITTAAVLFAALVGYELATNDSLPVRLAETANAVFSAILIVGALTYVALWPQERIQHVLLTVHTRKTIRWWCAAAAVVVMTGLIVTAATGTSLGSIELRLFTDAVAGNLMAAALLANELIVGPRLYRARACMIAAAALFAALLAVQLATGDAIAPRYGELIVDTISAVFIAGGLSRVALWPAQRHVDALAWATAKLACPRAGSTDRINAPA